MSDEEVVMSISAPWTKEQVAALNRFQHLGYVHEFTCPNDHGDGTRTLVATKDGWICLNCDYRQTWAWKSMLTPPTHPFPHEEAKQRGK